MRTSLRAYERAWGATPIFTRSGGSIPVVMLGFGLDDDGVHGANEHLSIVMFHRGVETAIVYLEEVARLSRDADAGSSIAAQGGTSA